MAQAVAELLGPETIGLLHIIPGVGHSAQALGSAPAVYRSNQERSGVAIGGLRFDTRTAGKQGNPSREALTAGQHPQLRHDARQRIQHGIG